MGKLAKMVAIVVVVAVALPLAAAEVETAKSAAEAGALGGKYDPGHPVSIRAAITEGFEGGTMPPAGWANHVTNASYTWKVQTASVNSGTYAADVEYDPALTPQEEVLYSPAVTATTEMAVQFYSMGSVYWCRDDFDNCDLDVYLDLDTTWDNGNETLVYTADDDWVSNFVWEQSSVNLDAYADSTTRYVAFVYSGSDGAQAALDDIEILTDDDVPEPPIVGCGDDATVLEEQFESWPPAGWQILNNGGDCVWQSNSTTANVNNTGGTGNAADADSDWCGSGTTMDTALLTPAMDLTGYVSAQLKLKAYYDDWSSADDSFAVDVSSDGGSSWTNLLTWAGADQPGQDLQFDLTPYASANVVVRFVAVFPGYYWNAQVDDVYVCGELASVAEADLDITKTANASGPMLPGEQMSFTFSVVNNGPDAATAVQVTDPLPAMMDYVSDTCGGLYTAGTHTWTWDVGGLANGAGDTCDLVVEMTPDADGAIVNTASVAGAESDPTPANDASQATVSAVQQIEAIPTTSPVGLAIMALALAAAAFFVIRRRV
jgi:uncharacterized repeat protein (TIGR01451 family)